MSAAEVDASMPVDATPVDEAFDLSAILHKAAVRHTSTVDTEMAAAAAHAAMLRLHAAEVESLAYVEGNIRSWAEGQEALERHTAQRLRTAHRKGVARMLLLRADAEEADARSMVEGEAQETIDALCHAGLAMQADAQKAQMDDLFRGEGNVRVAIAAAEMRDWCAMKSLSDDLLDDLHDVHATSPKAAAASPHEPIVADAAQWQEETRRLLLLEANLRYTIEMEHRKHWVAVCDVHELLFEAASPAGSPTSIASNASGRALRFDSPTTGADGSPSTAAAPPVEYDARGEAPAARPPYPRYCRPMVSSSVHPTADGSDNRSDPTMGPTAGAAEAAPTNDGGDAMAGGGGVVDGSPDLYDLNLRGVPQWLQEDIAADRQDVEASWELEWRTLHEGLRSYIALEYDWVLAGWRRVVRSDHDMFRRQGHMPASLRSPQKHMFHARLGLLERCMEDVLTEAPHLTSREGGASPPSKQPHAHRSPHQPHRPTDARDADASTPRPPQRPPPRAVNDSLLQSLLYQEVSNRGLIARDFEATLRLLARVHDEDLHRELNWSRGWCVTANARRALQPAAVVQRHLPPSYRGITDPKQPPTHSARPPVQPSVASSAKKPPAVRAAHVQGNGSVVDTTAGSTPVLCLPVPPLVMQRAKSASSPYRSAVPAH